MRATIALAVGSAFATWTYPSRSLEAQASSASSAHAAPASPSVAGEWNASYNTPGGPRLFKLLLTVDGMKVTGTVKRESGDSPLVGTVKGDTVQFAYSIQYNDHPLEMRISARVTGDSMKGSVDFAGQAQEGFEAKAEHACRKNSGGAAVSVYAPRG